MPLDHKAQLLICHEKIGNQNPGGRWAFCELPAFAWCHDCDMYVCEIHTIANHAGERLTLRADERRGR